MDKNILHSVLETVTAGQTINIVFNQPFTELTGDYLVLQSKTGRGRGGSRVLEIRSVTNPERSFGALEVDGKEKTLGTGTSDCFSTVTVNGKVHGLEDPAEATRKPRTARSDGSTATPRKPASSTPVARSTSSTVGQKVATALGDVLQQNPSTVFKLTGKSTGSHLTGEWRVTSFTRENGVLQMECVDVTNSERTLSFNSSVDGVNLKDAEVFYVE